MIRIKNLIKPLLAAAGLAAATMFTTPRVEAQEFLYPTTRPLTLFDTTVSNETVTASSRTRIAVPPQTVTVVQWTMSAAAAGTSNVVLKFVRSLDGDNWTTDTVDATLAANGTNVVTKIVALETNLLTKYISLENISTTQTNLVTLSNARLGFIPFTTKNP